MTVNMWVIVSLLWLFEVLGIFFLVFCWFGFFFFYKGSNMGTVVCKITKIKQAS